MGQRLQQPSIEECSTHPPSLSRPLLKHTKQPVCARTKHPDQGTRGHINQRFAPKTNRWNPQSWRVTPSLRLASTARGELHITYRVEQVELDKTASKNWFNWAVWGKRPSIIEKLGFCQWCFSRFWNQSGKDLVVMVFAAVPPDLEAPVKPHIWWNRMHSFQMPRWDHTSQQRLKTWYCI